MKKGFTLLELIVVVIIIGILASIALPRFLEIAEKGRLSEGLSMLQALRGSQIRFRAAGSAYAAVIGNLDVTFTTQRYFTATVAAAAGDDNCCATVTRNGADRPTGWGGYTFSITPNGEIICTSSGAVGAPDECVRLGYVSASCP